MDFSKKIDNLMKKNNIKNLRQLATELEIPYTTLWDYYSNPIRLEKANLMYIKKIAQYLNCTIDYLVYDNVFDENEVLIDGYDLDSTNMNNSKELITRFKVKFSNNDEDKDKMEKLIKFMNDNIENYKVEKVNFDKEISSDKDARYKEILKSKGIMDENENIKEEDFNRLIQIADMIQGLNDKKED